MKSLLPIFKSDNRDLMMMQTKWSQLLNQYLSCPLLNGRILDGLTLRVGNNSINHLSGQPITGYLILRQDGPAVIYEVPSDMPKLTLVLNSSAVVSISLYVF